MRANNTGKRRARRLPSLWRVLLALFSLTTCLTIQADVTAIVDRHQVAVGDSFRLIITSTEGEDLDDIDFHKLEKHFDILQRSSSNKMSIVNGSRSHTKQLQLDLAPRAEGTWQIPPLLIDGEITQAITVKVQPQPQLETGDQVVLFEAEVDKNEVYVQGQVILTLRVTRAINLEDPSLAPVELEDAFVKPLEQQSFQRTIDGRPWLVHEVRYAIFPEQSGTLVIPPQRFTARESVGRRSLFDLRSGRGLRRSSEPISIDVLPRPRQFPSSNWLPARSLSVEETWSTPPEKLKVGESATRTIRLRGEGLQGAQLPPILFQPIEGVKFYPDQPEISEQEVSTGLLGMRRDSAAIVPTQAGTVTLPEIRIPWWDSQSETVRYATLPAREINIAPAATTTTSTPNPAIINDATNAATVATDARNGSLVWKLIALISVLGWLLTGLYLFWLQRKSGAREYGGVENSSERRAFGKLKAECESNAPVAARQALIAWARALTGNSKITAVAQVGQHFSDRELSAQINALEQAIYGGNGDSSENSSKDSSENSGETWRGAALAACTARLRKTESTRGAGEQDKLGLYPESTAAGNHA